MPAALLGALDVTLLCAALLLRRVLVPGWQKGPLIDPAAPYAPEQAVLLTAVALCVLLDLYLLLIVVGRRALGARAWVPYLSLLLAAGASELAMRAWISSHELTFFRPHPTLQWEVRPNLHGFRNRVGNETLDTNADGLRDVKVPRQKPEDEYRILVLGDSSNFGIGVEAVDTFTSRLQRQLEGRIPGKRLVVMNGACPGWTTDQALRFLDERGFAYGPDLVLAGFNNDPGPEYLTDASRVPTGALLHANRLLFHMETWLLVREVVLSSTRALFASLPLDEADRARRSTARVPLEDFLANLSTLQRRTSEHGARFTWINMPINRMEIESLRDFVNPRYREEASRLSREAPFPLIDVDGRWLRTREPDLHQGRHLFHPNARGHERMAQQVASELLQARLLPGAQGSLRIEGPEPVADVELLRLALPSPSADALDLHLASQSDLLRSRKLKLVTLRKGSPSQLAESRYDLLLADAELTARALGLRQDLIVLGAFSSPDDPASPPSFLSASLLASVADLDRIARLTEALGQALAPEGDPLSLRLDAHLRSLLEEQTRHQGWRKAPRYGDALLRGEVPLEFRNPGGMSPSHKGAAPAPSMSGGI